MSRGYYWIGLAAIFVVSVFVLTSQLKGDPYTESTSEAVVEEHRQPLADAELLPDPECPCFPLVFKNADGVIVRSLQSPSGRQNDFPTQCVHRQKEILSDAVKQKNDFPAKSLHMIQKLLAQDADLGLVDIGANVGVYTLSAANMGRRVVAIEPNRQNLRCLKRTIQMNHIDDQVVVLNKAMGGRHQEVTLWLRTGANMGNNQVLDGDQAVKDATKGEFQVIQAIILNDLLDIMDFQKAILKVDVEGFEANVFNVTSSLQFLSTIQVPVIVMEWFQVKNKSPEVVTTLIDYLYGLGYVPHGLSSKAEVVETPSKREKYKSWSHDVVWIKQYNHRKSTNRQ